MRSSATRIFLANIFLGFSAEEFRRSSRRSALGEKGGLNSMRALERAGEFWEIIRR